MPRRMWITAVVVVMHHQLNDDHQSSSPHCTLYIIHLMGIPTVTHQVTIQTVVFEQGKKAAVVPETPVILLATHPTITIL